MPKRIRDGRIGMKPPRLHIQAWGSDKYPDLDYYADEQPRDLTWKYPYVDVALLQAIPYSAIRAYLDKENKE
jgi:hypothetical protein